MFVIIKTIILLDFKFYPFLFEYDNYFALINFCIIFKKIIYIQVNIYKLKGRFGLWLKKKAYFRYLLSFCSLCSRQLFMRQYLVILSRRIDYKCQLMKFIFSGNHFLTTRHPQKKYSI